MFAINDFFMISASTVRFIMAADFIAEHFEKFIKVGKFLRDALIVRLLLFTIFA